jgi:ubiquinone/menaquinone biosynthesis C-methylase UbiE
MSIAFESLLRTARAAVQTADDEYHYRELEIALDPASQAHSLPVIHPGEKVLDIGCGAGQTLLAASPYRVRGPNGEPVITAERAPDEPEWGYGIDIDRSALALGHRWTDKFVLNYGFAEAIPFPDKMFDIVVSRVTLVYADMPKAASEMRRVLKPGGRLWLTVHTLAMVRKQMAGKNWRGLLYLAYVAMNGVIFHFTQRPIKLFGKRESWQTASGMRRLLNKHGFTNVRTEKRGVTLFVSAQG